MAIKFKVFLFLALLSNIVYAGQINREETLVVATAQINSSDVGDFDKMKTLASEAKQQGATLIIYPESSVFGWLNPAVFTEAEPIPGKYSDLFADIAKSAGIWVAAGLAEKGPKASAEEALPNTYYAYDSGILVNPDGELVIHHRKHNVLKNAFNQEDCKRILGEDQCSYFEGPISDVTTVDTPFGKTSLLVCADAYIPSEYNPGTAIRTLKEQKPEFVIVPWGITAATQEECGGEYFNATGYASAAAKFLETSYVIGANGIGNRPYGRYLPSVYCGTSGYSDPTGVPYEAKPLSKELAIFSISSKFTANAGPIWNNAVDAPKKCQKTCSAHNSTWHGEWWTTVWNKMSVCECTLGVE